MLVFGFENFKLMATNNKSGRVVKKWPNLKAT